MDVTLKAGRPQVKRRGFVPDPLALEPMRRVAIAARVGCASCSP